MKPNHARQRTGGFTGWDLLICVVVVGVLAALLLPALHRSKSKAARVNCVSNLMQVGLAFRLWSNDNGESFPWQVSTNKGGTLQLVSSGKVFPHLLAISNEVSTPKVFVCPNDSGRTRVGAWDRFVSDTNVSYFIGLDASAVYPQMFLSGDRNLSTSTNHLSGLVLLMTNTPLQWAPGLHAPAGNVGLADGSGAQILASTVQGLRENDTNAALRFVFP